MEQQITVTMSHQTVDQLAQSGFVLYGFKAVQCSDKAGRPLVWFQRNNYSMQTNVQWSNQYQGYGSVGTISPNGQIDVNFCVDMQVGQLWTIDQPYGGEDVTEGSSPTALTIMNSTDSQFTCGILEQNDGVFTPSCAFPLYSGDIQLIVPLDKVLLLFSTQPLQTGAVVVEAYGRGIFIDINNAPLRTVNFDINTGWSTDPSNQTWAQLVPANSQLVSLLIQESQYLAQQAQELLKRRSTKRQD